MIVIINTTAELFILHYSYTGKEQYSNSMLLLIVLGVILMTQIFDNFTLGKRQMQ